VQFELSKEKECEKLQVALKSKAKLRKGTMKTLRAVRAPRNLSSCVNSVVFRRSQSLSHARFALLFCRMPVHPSDNRKCIPNWNNDD
jgi:hypothetical protein